MLLTFNHATMITTCMQSATITSGLMCAYTPLYLVNALIAR